MPRSPVGRNFHPNWTTSTATSASFLITMHRGGGVEVEGRRVGGCVRVWQDRNAVLRSSVTTATRWMEETKRGAADIEERKGNRKEIRIDPQK